MPRESLSLQIDEDGTGYMAGFLSGAPGLALLPTEVDDMDAGIAEVSGQLRGVDHGSDAVHGGTYARAWRRSSR
jgi:hypothetical protein